MRVLAVLLAAALSGCAAGSDVGPLGGSGGRAALCTAVPGTAPVVFGNEVLRNDSDEPVTVDAVRLVEADGLVLTESFLLPVQDRVLLGTRAVPPETGPWAQRRAAVGAVLDARAEANLALLLDRRGDGSFSDVEVRYSAGGEEHTVLLAHALEVVATGVCPSR